MKKIFTLLFFFLFLKVSPAQQIQLSKNSKISILTFGSGDSLDSAFGHSAFRIQDRSNSIDIVYGYGGFDFNTPNFYLKFAQGKLNYSMTKNNFQSIYKTYTNYDRSIKEQILNLTQTEKQKLYNFLVHNYKPENRNYLYEFFFNNCATKIKDLTNKILNNSITFNTPKNLKQETFRTLIHNNLKKNSWGSLGIDIALGSVIDRKASLEQHMFLPKNIHRFFKTATIKQSNKPLVKENKILYNKKTPLKQTLFIFTPLFVFGLIAIGILWVTYKDYKNKKHSKWLDIALFSITGIIGILILLLWFATDHTGTHQNYNLLWAFALNLLMVTQFLKNKPASWFIKYLKLLVILLCLMALHWSIGVQIFAIGLIPFLVALFIRYTYLINYYSHKFK